MLIVYLTLHALSYSSIYTKLNGRTHGERDLERGREQFIDKNDWATAQVSNTKWMLDAWRSTLNEFLLVHSQNETGSGTTTTEIWMKNSWHKLRVELPRLLLLLLLMLKANEYGIVPATKWSNWIRSDSVSVNLAIIYSLLWDNFGIYYLLTAQCPLIVPISVIV